MQKLIENALAKEGDSTSFKVVQIGRKHGIEKTLDLESVLAPEITRKEIKRLIKQEQHVSF
jgi:hypothetical protein